MYICEKCKKQIGPNKKMYKKVIEKRQVKYGNKIIKYNKVVDKETQGTEIVKEINICEECRENI